MASPGGDFTTATSDYLANNAAGTSLGDGDPPPVGDGFWYLVRAVNCQVAGTWNSGGTAQQGSRDAEIAASANTCP